MLTPQEARAVRHPPLAARGHVDHLHQPQAQRGARARRPRHRAPPGQDDRDGADGRRDGGGARAPMVGRDVLLRVEKAPASPGETLLVSRISTCPTTAGSRRFAACRSTCARGEIVAIAGVDGNGQTELIDAITGFRRPTGARRGRRQRRHGPERARSLRGRARSHSRGPPAARPRARLQLAENVALHDFRKAPYSRFGWLFPTRLIERARRLIGEFDVRGGGPETPAARSRAATSRK